MNRREFCHLSGSVLAIGAMNARAQSNESRPEWKTAIGLNGFASGERKYGVRYPLWEILQFAEDKAFDGVELVEAWPSGSYPKITERQRCEALRRLYERYSLRTFSMQIGAGGAFDPAADKRKAWLNVFRERAKLASYLGCDCVGMWPGGGLRGQTISEAIRHLAHSFSEAARIGEQFGLTVAFEIEPPFVFNTEAHLIQILERSEGSALKTIYDPSHFDLMSGSEGRPDRMLSRIGVNQIGYVHLTDSDGTLRDQGTSKHLACGDGHIDIPSSLGLLRREGFAGWIMVDQWEVPDPYDASVKGLRAIESSRG